MDTLEQKVADTILERSTDTITIEGKEYHIAPPTPGTLIMISGMVSTMPVVRKDADNVMYEVLSTAKDLSVIGKIAATLILGAKRIKENRIVLTEHVESTKKWSWRKFRYVVEQHKTATSQYEVDYLAEKILDEVTPQTLLRIVAKRLGELQIADFFELTTSLSAANLIKRTKEVETVSGD